MDNQFWQDRKTLITGHTGFKGSWLTLYLNSLGADIYGYSLKPDTNPSFFLDAKIFFQTFLAVLSRKGAY